MSDYYDPLDNKNNAYANCVGTDPLFSIEREMENEAREKQAKKEHDQSLRREWWLSNKRQMNQMQRSDSTQNLYTLKQVIVVSIIAFLVGMIVHWMFGSRNGRYRETTVGYQKCLLDTRTGEVSKLKIGK